MEILADTKKLFKRKNWIVRTYYSVRSWFKYTLNKNHINLIKEAYKGAPWDYCNLLSLEKAKLKEMADYLEKANRYVGVEYDVKRIRLCISLIEIFNGERELFHFDGNLVFEEIDKNSDEYDGGRTKRISQSPDFKYHCHVKVNLRNIDRFVEDKGLQGFYVRSPHELYELKARRLYHKIRFEHEQEWWD